MNAFVRDIGSGAKLVAQVFAAVVGCVVGLAWLLFGGVLSAEIVGRYTDNSPLWCGLAFLPWALSVCWLIGFTREERK